jgi:cysteine desulfurase
VQTAGKVEIDLGKVPADYLSVTGHKIGAPKGIGALFVRRKVPFSPLIHGGHQERGRRGGTESIPLLVGLGKAAVLARKQLPEITTAFCRYFGSCATLPFSNAGKRRLAIGRKRVV